MRTRYIALAEPVGPRSGVTGHGATIRILIIGDSSAVGVGVPTQAEALLGQVTARLQDRLMVHYDLIAKTGAKTADVLGWLDDLPEARYDFVVTALGVNDVTKGLSLRKWLQQQAALFDRITARFDPSTIIVSGLPPIGQFPLLPHPLRWVLGRQAARFDRHLHALAAQRSDCVALRFSMGLDESNMSEDGFHPGPIVYAAWADEVIQVILADDDWLDGAQTAQ